MKSVNLRSARMAYDDVGSGPAIVLLHGYPFNRSLWREQVEALRESHRVITPDLRGFGETPAAAGETATMKDMAGDVAELLDQLEIRRATVGGLSMGGYVALAFYRRFPLRVRALLLADTRAQADTDEARRTRAEQAQTILQDGMEAIADDMLSKLLAPATFKEQPDVVARVRQMITSTPPEGAAAALRGMAARVDQRDFLPSIYAPTLIVVGSLDKLTPPPDSELMRREIRGSRLEIIEGAAHLSNLERPAAFNRALESFLRSLQP
jgi:pimeloyl-ACP methyl ester carboxylesterase